MLMRALPAVAVLYNSRKHDLQRLLHYHRRNLWDDYAFTIALRGVGCICGARNDRGIWRFMVESSWSLVEAQRGLAFCVYIGLFL